MTTSCALTSSAALLRIAGLCAATLAAVAALSACVPRAPEGFVNKQGQVCTRETPTGSNIPVTRCRTQDEIEQEQRAVQEMRNAVHPTQGPGPQGGAGR